MPVTDSHKQVDNVDGEGAGVEGEGADLGHVRAKRAVDAAALDAQDGAQVNGDPVGVGARVAVGAGKVRFVAVANLLKELLWVVIVGGAVAADVAGSGADSDASVYTGSDG